MDKIQDELREAVLGAAHTSKKAKDTETVLGLMKMFKDLLPADEVVIPAAIAECEELLQKAVQARERSSPFDSHHQV